VGGDPALGQADLRHAFADGALVVQQELQQPQPGRVGEGAEELRDHLHPGARVGQERQAGFGGQVHGASIRDLTSV